MLYGLITPAFTMLIYFGLFGNTDFMLMKIIATSGIVFGYPLHVILIHYTFHLVVSDDEICLKCNDKMKIHNKKGCSICKCKEKVYVLDGSKYEIKK